MPQDVRAEFNRAAGLHRQGKLDDAIEIYRRLVKLHPSAFEVMRLLVFALLQSGRAKEALLAARKAREVHPSNAHAHVLLGASLQAMRQWDRALAAFEAAAVLDPALTEAHYLAGNALGLLGRHAEAVARYDRVLALDPRTAEALANRAAALSQLGRAEAALRDCEALIVMQPWQPRHFLSKAGALLALGLFEGVIAAAERALHLAPQLADAHFLKAQGFEGQGDFAAAQAAFAAAVAAAPERVEWRGDLSRVLRGQGRLDEALAVCDEALEHDPANAALTEERAEVRRARGDIAAALADAEAAAALAPGLARAHTLVGWLKADLGDAGGVARAAAAAIAAEPDFPAARCLAATGHLAEGRWAEGWAAYESRADMLPPAYLPLPFRRWDGREAVQDLIVVGEQDIGDLIMFGRLLRLLADRGIRARLLIRAELVPLLSRIDARVPVVSSLGPADGADPGLRWVALGSLPGLIAPDPATWPRAPYLTADPERIARWRGWRFAAPVPSAPEPSASLAQPEGAASLAPDDGGAAEAGLDLLPPPVEAPPPLLRVGIHWQGEPSPAVDVGRPVPLTVFAPLAALERVQLVSLQGGAAAAQMDEVPFGGRIARLPRDRDADGIYVDTAGILQHLDLVVTADTAMAHLAGARGRRAFVALRALPDWRWGHSGDTTALYPSLRLFRQLRAGDWDEVFARIAAAVAGIARAKAD